jgi:hypothetical protein
MAHRPGPAENRRMADDDQNKETGTDRDEARREIDRRRVPR